MLHCSALKPIVYSAKAIYSYDLQKPEAAPGLRACYVTKGDNGKRGQRAFAKRSAKERPAHLCSATSDGGVAPGGGAHCLHGQLVQP